MTSDSPDNTFLDSTLSSLWRERAVKYGARCVINLSHPPEDYSLVTGQQMRILLPPLTRLLNGSERTLLDYGCGPGRFSGELAKLVRGDVVAFDICQDLLDLAPASHGVTYTSNAADLQSVTYESYFDVIWICLVLGGIPDPKCRRVAEGLMRNLKDDGLLFMVEHTSDTDPGSDFWRFRTIGEYQSMFSRVPLSKLGHYFDFGKEVTVLAGRKAPMSAAASA